MLLNAATSQVKCANNPLVSSSNITKQLTYLEPSQTSAMGLFCKNSSQRKAVNYFRKKLYFRWTIRFWIRFWPGSIFFVSFYCLKNVFKASESVLRSIFQVRFLSSRNSSWGSGKKKVGYRFRFLFFLAVFLPNLVSKDLTGNLETVEIYFWVWTIILRLGKKGFM